MFHHLFQHFDQQVIMFLHVSSLECSAPLGINNSNIISHLEYQYWSSIDMCVEKVNLLLRAILPPHRSAGWRESIGDALCFKLTSSDLCVRKLCGCVKKVWWWQLTFWVNAHHPSPPRISDRFQSKYLFNRPSNRGVCSTIWCSIKPRPTWPIITFVCGTRIQFIGKDAAHLLNTSTNTNMIKCCVPWSLQINQMAPPLTFMRNFCENWIIGIILIHNAARFVSVTVCKP